MKLLSKAFEQKKRIPKKYSCEGENFSPPLQIEKAPTATVSFALIVDDPDAPMGTFDHWIAWNIPGKTTSLAEGVKLESQGKNHFGNEKYDGPMPPPGPEHRYFFKLYALDCTLSLKKGSTKGELQSAIKGHILAEAELMGTYQRYTQIS